MKPLTSKAKPGDLFYVPAIDKDGTYGFVIGRYIEAVEPNVGYLIEVFEAFYTVPPASLESVDLSRRLFRPILCSFRFAEVPRWKILFSDPSYDRSKSDYDNISIAFFREIWKGGRLIAARREEMVGLEDATVWRTLHVILRVNAHLAGFFEPSACYDYHRLPENERVDSPTAVAKAIEVANVIDERSKSWSKSKNARGS